MKKKRIKAKVADLVLNEGQLEWLPRNPRQWTRDDINLTKQSLERDPDFQEDKPILVTPLDKKLLVFAGNLRTTAAKQMKLQTFEAIEYIPESDEDYETIKRRAMLDNGSFGSWDIDALANEWDDCPLADWGVDVGTDVNKEVERVKKDKELLGRVPFTEILKEEHNYIVLYFDNEVDWLQAQTLFQLKPVKALPTTKAGEQSLAFQKRIGVGRVINGAKAIENLLADMEDRK